MIHDLSCGKNIGFFAPHTNSEWAECLEGRSFIRLVRVAKLVANLGNTDLASHKIGIVCDKKNQFGKTENW